MRPRCSPLALILVGFSLLAAAQAASQHLDLSTTPDWTAVETRLGAALGSHVSNAGDVNGDGFGDILVGAPRWDNFVEAFEGRASLYLGSATGLRPTPAWTFEGNEEFARLSLARSAGDVNGDGFGDVILGAPEYGRFTVQGRAWLILGSSTGLSATPAWIAGGSHEEAVFGYVAGVGDVNGDGFDDVMVGAPGQNFNLFDAEGAAFLFLGSSNPTAKRDQVFKGEQPYSGFGFVAGAGDINGDGFADVVIGSPGYIGDVSGGRVYVYKGANRGLRPKPVAVLEIEGETVGLEQGSAGDINADGFGDFYVISGVYTAQKIYVYLGSRHFGKLQPDLVLQPDPPFSDLTFASAGDVDGDGFGDVVMGVPAQDRAFVYRGTAAGLDPVPLQILSGAQVGEFFGTSVSTAGNVNGDGFDDVIVGAPNYSPGGRALVFHGGP